MAQVVPTSSSHPPTSTVTIAQWLYIWVMQALGSAVLGGGINFAIATGMYRHNRHLVWLWKVNHNTLAGDAAVTIFVQTIITWLLDSAMVCNDVRTRAYGIRPISMSPKALNNKFLSWYISAEGMELLELHITLKARLKCFVIGIIKAFLLCILVFFIWWPITVAILVGVGHSIGAGQYQYNHWPEPQIFKLILGFTLGLLVTPVVVLLALAAKGRQYTDSVAAQNSQHVRLTKEAETLTTVI